MDTAVIYEDMMQETSVSKVSLDSSQSTPISPPNHAATSALDLSINPYYDAGYDLGQEDGYHDGILLSTLMIPFFLSVDRKLPTLRIFYSFLSSYSWTFVFLQKYNIYLNSESF
jgi:hypothetical protein